MLDIAAELREWCDQDRDFAVATLVTVDGSAPRLPGAALAVDATGAAVGSVSGGCVEGAVYELCRDVLVSGEPVLVRFGPDHDDPFLAQVTCGGVIEVLVVPVRGADRPTVEPVLRGDHAALARVVDGPPGMLGRSLLVRVDGSYAGSLGGTAGSDETVAAEVRPVLAAGRHCALVVTGAVADRHRQPVTLFVEARVEPPRMLVFGAIDYAAALTTVGRFLGYRVTVCDARPVFATRERFPDAHEVVVDWPHRYLRETAVDDRTVICVLTHDAKFDVPVLERALALPAAYVGALGSRRTHADRMVRLRAEGVPERQLARLHSPLGLDLGARTPEETAISIAAEIVAATRGGSGRPLTGGEGSIHKDSDREYCRVLTTTTDPQPRLPSPADTGTDSADPLSAGAGAAGRPRTVVS
ncbi:XdhC/CoxI family protein [Streptomyces sp. NPDC005827]|uniref:XdhC/CoxI family protein n=1 Tax=Streptomyces sp. NPDC005827 TaxID=3157070 RepID=UPI0033D2497F